LINVSIPEVGDFGSILELRLDVCEHLLTNEQIRTSLEELPSGRWVSLRFVTVEMFEKLFGDDQTKLTEAQWLRIRDLLIRLTDDPDPDMESDRPKEGWFGNNDPITLAINHVRSEAILSLIFYA
jgi:hypothetical protein